MRVTLRFLQTWFSAYLAFIRFLHCSVFKGHRRLATACISYQTHKSLSRTFFGRIEQFFTSSQKNIFRLCQGPLQCPVPDGLISISQITTSVNYFFTFFDKIYTGSISIITIIKDLIIYKNTLRHVYISFCAGCLHYLFSNTKSTATRTIALAPTRACIFPKSLPAASANSLVCAAI